MMKGVGRGIGRRSFVPLLFGGVLLYFAIHFLQGGHGILAYQHFKKELIQAEATLTEKQAAHDALAHRVQLLKTQGLCPDLLEERAKAVLGFANPQEVILTHKPQDSQGLK
jgi:cell division protein FtsB